VYGATSDFPLSERFGLQSQVRRAAVSIASNVVEGCARDSERELLRFLDIAFGSARELLYLIDVSERLGFVNLEAAGRIKELGDRCAGALIRLRQAIRKS
jgi:four helix bundle protein